MLPQPLAGDGAVLVIKGVFFKTGKTVVRLHREPLHKLLPCFENAPAARVLAVGLGERFLLENADPDSDQNRRVEFQALS